MSREQQNLQRGIQNEITNADELLDVLGRRDLYIMAQRQLIGYLADKISEIDTFKNRMDCECLAAIWISEVYHDWYKLQSESVSADRFLILYRGTHGPINLFHALFPNITIDEFLSGHLVEEQKINENVEMTRVREKILQVAESAA